MTSTLTAAVGYTRKQRPVLPLNEKIPRCQHGVKDATCDEKQIRAWWSTWPNANVGLAMGHGLVALDVDAHKGGDETLIELQRKHGELPSTLMQSTPSGGLHYIFAIPTELKIRNAVAFAPGLDTRAAGGYIVAWPSVVKGRRYRWINRERPAPMPDWLVELTKAHEPKDASAPPRHRFYSDDLDRRIRRASAYVRRMPPAISGEGGHVAALLAARALVRGFMLPPAVALDVLLADFNPRCRGPFSRRELEHKIASALKEARMPFGKLLDDSRSVGYGA